ncbi:MAG: glycosyltransferase family 2 protein [Imperialibacter sp.]
MNPIVSAIYVNHNTSALLLESASSLIEKSVSSSFEIIIIDNASNEKEKSILRSASQKKKTQNIRLIFSEVNLGFGKANNLGAKHASGKYLFFINPDTLILNDVLEIFVSFMRDSGPNVAACGGGLLTKNLQPNHSYGNFPGILLEVCNIGLGLSFLLNGYYERKIAIGAKVHGSGKLQVPYIVGADVFIRNELFWKVGGFDENYFLYYEETDVFLRLSKLGLTSYILPEAKIIHFEGGAVGNSQSNTFNRFKHEVLLRSKLYYYKKWYPAAYLPVVKTLIFFQILVQFLKGRMGNDIKSLLRSYLTSISQANAQNSVTNE